MNVLRPIGGLVLSAVIAGSACTAGDEAVLAADDSSNTEQADPVADATGETTAVADTTTTAAPTTEAPTAEPGLDNTAISNSKTFDIYRTRVSAEQAIHCVLATELDPNYGRSTPEDLVWGDLFDLHIVARSENSSEAVEAYLSAVEEVDATEYEPRLRKIRAGVAILEATTDDGGAKTTFSATLREVDLALAEIEVGAATVDIAPYVRIALDETFASYETDGACPFVGGTDSPIAKAMSNFGGTNERFGGRGPDARSRCHISAALDLALEAVAAGEPIEDHVTAGFTMWETQWYDRAPDDAATAAAASWADGLAAGTDSAELAASVLDEWLDYRTSTPEGFILCPLDRGWEEA